jgi:hypothetical protein
MPAFSTSTGLTFMKRVNLAFVGGLFGLLILAGANANATGLATCDSGPKSGWQPVEKLEQALKEKGYTVRRIKEDGGCYEVYALNEKGERGEYYFHPVTLAPVPTKAR